MIPGLIVLAAAALIALPGLVQRLRKLAPTPAPVWQPDLDANVTAYESMPAWMRR